MNFATIQDLLNRLDLTALARGLNSTTPIVVTINNSDTNHLPCLFVVAHNEPVTLDIPLNVMWYVRDSGSPDYDKLLRRASRSPSGSYSGTWVEETNVVLALSVAQVWDQPKPDDQGLLDHTNQLGNAHNLVASDLGAIGEEGGTITGPLLVREVLEEEYAEAEAMPKSWIDAMLDQMRSITENIIQSFANINAQIDNLRTRVEILEASLLGLKGYLYTTSSASDTWNINHAMNNTRVVVQVYEGDEVILPSTIRVVDADNVQITFAHQVEGYAQILPIVEYA